MNLYPKLPSKMPKALFCPSGNKKKPLYKYEYDETHHCPRRVKNGEMDIQDFIQQSADDVDFKSIGKMLVDTRDNVADHFKLEGEEMDITRLPRNIHEYEALHNKMKSTFDELDPSVKTLFQNDFDLFSRAWKNGSIKNILGAAQPKALAPKAESKPAESEAK